MNFLPWDFSVIPEYFLTFRAAAFATLQITTLGILLGLFLGFIFSLMKISDKKIFNIPASIYIWAIRGTPLLLQLFVIYFGLAGIINIPRYTSAVIALGIHNGAYIAEIFRGAIISINRGQREAGLALGMTEWQVMRRIILPQAFKRSVPPLGNQFIIALKDSSLASTIAVRELLLQTRQVGSSNYLMMEMLMIAAVYYLAMTTVLSWAVNKVELKLAVSEGRV
ncbi:MAG: amino acid ABC transporter permease [Candidatus Muiribacteriota bacterium]